VTSYSHSVVTTALSHCWRWKFLGLKDVLAVIWPRWWFNFQHGVSRKTPFTRYNWLSKRLYNRFDNRLYRVNKHPTGCQMVVKTVWQPVECLYTRYSWLSNWLYNPVWQPAVYTIQAFVKLVVKQVWQPVECFYTRYNRLSNWFDNRLYRVNGALVFSSNQSCNHSSKMHHFWARSTGETDGHQLHLMLSRYFDGGT